MSSAGTPVRAISASIREHVSFEREVPHADFFNSQIQERIAEVQRADERAHAPATSAAGWFSWLRTPWVLASAAAAVAIAFVVLRQERPSTQVLSLYAPNPNIQANAYHNADADATVVMLNGLESIPADHEIAGINVHHSEMEPQQGTTTLFNEQGNALLVMTKNGWDQPVVASR